MSHARASLSRKPRERRMSVLTLNGMTGRAGCAKLTILPRLLLSFAVRRRPGQERHRWTSRRSVSIRPPGRVAAGAFLASSDRERSGRQISVTSRRSPNLQSRKSPGDQCGRRRTSGSHPILTARHDRP